MVSASTRTEAANPLASLTHSSSTSGNKTNSFAQQLAGAIRSEGHPSLNTPEEGSIGRAAVGQNPGGSQVLVASKATTAEEIPTMMGMGTAEGTAPVMSAIPSRLRVAPGAGTRPVISTPKAVSTAVSAASPELIRERSSATATKVPVTTSTVPQPVNTTTETEADAYWAAQPAAVQVLRGMPDDDAKEKLALKLANQGYSVDTQIMVWNWDPQMTMQVRENQGYAWVPSFGQSNVPIGPGLSMPGVPNSYSPNSPPAGSIPVSTAFAVGTIVNPLVQVDQTVT
jgi:hypothetical protein